MKDDVEAHAQHWRERGKRKEETEIKRERGSKFEGDSSMVTGGRKGGREGWH
jgi:hypothetical protein